MRIVLLPLLFCLLCSGAIFGQPAIGFLQDANFPEVPNSFIEAFVNYYHTPDDVQNGAPLIFQEYSRHYYANSADTMFARLNIDSIDVTFKECTQKGYQYISENGMYRIKTASLKGGRIKLILYKAYKPVKTFVLCSKTFSG